MTRRRLITNTQQSMRTRTQQSRRTQTAGSAEDTVVPALFPEVPKGDASGMDAQDGMEGQ